MANFVQDIRYAVRTLLKSGKFSLVAVAILAIGIGANTAIFSIIDALLLRPLPFHEPDRLVRLYESEQNPGSYPFAGPDFVDWRAQNSTFSEMSLYGWWSDRNLSNGGNADRVVGTPTDAHFFSLLGVRPLLGRAWAQGEDQPGRNEVVVLSYALWQSRFGGDPKAIGQTLELDAVKHRVIGVMPAGFNFPPGTELWTPIDMSPKGLGLRGSHSYNAIGRMNPGVSIDRARADLTLIAARLEKAYPDSNYKVGAVVRDLRKELVGASGDALNMMLAAVGLVLLIACANVANLLLSRALARQKEMAVRSSLGASRSRLLRQLLTESVLLSLAGGAGGVLLAMWLIDLAPKIKSFPLPSFNLIQLNGSVLAFTFALAVVTGVLFGLVPAFQTARRDQHEYLKGGAGSALSPSRQRRFLMSALVAAEIALSMLLLIPTGLLLKDFVRVHRMDIGVRREGVWTGAVQLPEAAYKTLPQQAGFARRLLEQVRRIPGVRTASLSSHVPLEGGSNYNIQLRERISERGGPLVESHQVTPEYFRAMGIPLLKGRLFADADVRLTGNLDVPLVEAFEKGAFPSPAELDRMEYPVVINEKMARTFWPNENPVGKMFTSSGNHGPWRQVIGVVGDVRQRGMAAAPRPEAYGALYASERLYLVLHTSVSPAAITPAVRSAVAAIDPSLALSRTRTMEDVVSDNVRGQRFLSSTVGSFAAIAALLAAIGLYAVLSYVVIQRTREIGIRMSLGATRSRVLGEFMREGMTLTAFGFAIGVAGAFVLGRIMQSMLNGLQPRDPAIFAAAAGVLAAVALLACFIPARRASKLDPLSALRQE